MVKMGIVSQEVQTEIHFSDSDRYNATFLIHNETIEGREASDFSGKLDPDSLLVQMYKSDHLVEITVSFEFSKFRNFFGFSPEQISTEYEYGEDPVHSQYDPEKVIITDYKSENSNPFSVSIEGDYAIKHSDHYSGPEPCDCCKRPRPEFMITNGPEYFYLHEDCFERLQAIYDVIRKVNSDLLTWRLV